MRFIQGRGIDRQDSRRFIYLLMRGSIKILRRTQSRLFLFARNSLPTVFGTCAAANRTLSAKFKNLFHKLPNYSTLRLCVLNGNDSKESSGNTGS